MLFMFSGVRGEYVGLGPKQKRKAKARKYQKGAEHVPPLRKPSLGTKGRLRWRVRRSEWCTKNQGETVSPTGGSQHDRTLIVLRSTVL